MSEIKLSKNEFSGIWNELNREFPPYKVPADVLAQQADRWYRELREFTLDCVNDALSDWLRREARRPKLANLRAGCSSYVARINVVFDLLKKKQLPEIDSNHCPCGCGGSRWASVLFDRDGNPRVEKIVGADGKQYDATRDHIECLANRRDIIPHHNGELLGRDARGIPVWIIRDHPLEAAA